MKTKLSARKDRAFRYWETTRWLLRDVLSMHPRGVILVVILYIASLALKFAAFVILSKYLHILAVAGEISIPIYRGAIDGHSYKLLVIVSLVTLGCLTLSFTAKYVADVKLLRLAGQYEMYCTKRAARYIASYGGHAKAHKWKAFYPKILGGYPRYCALTARLMVRLILPALTATVAVAALFYIDAVLTGILVLLVVTCIPLLYRVSLRAVRYSRALEEQAKAVGRAKRVIMERLENLAKIDPKALSKGAVDETFAQERSLGEAIGNYIGRLKVTEESNLLTGLLMGVAIFAILLYKGLELLGAAQGWALIAVYFIILRVCLGGLMQSANILTAINRLYPQVSRYSSCLGSLMNLEAQGGPACPPSNGWTTQSQKAQANPIEMEEEDEL